MKAKMLIILIILLICIQMSYAKRIAPPEVDSILYKDMELKVRNDPKPGNIGCIYVYKKNTKELILFKQIYFIVYDLKLERDIQDIYITKLEIKKDTIIIHNEIGFIYSLNMTNYEVTVIKGSSAIRGVK